MGGEDHAVRARHPLQQHPDQRGAFARGGIAHRVGDVDGAGPGLDRGFHHAAQIVMLGARRVHRRPLHVVAEVAGAGDRFMDARHHVVLAQLGDVAVQRRGADEGMDARLAGMADRLPAAVDILVIGAGEAADHRGLRLLGNLADGGEIAFRGDGEPGLDDIYAHLVQQRRDLQLLGMAHGGAGGLLAIAQGGVEDQHAVVGGGRSSGLGHVGHRRSLSVCFCLGSGACHLRAVAPKGTLRGG